MPFDIYGPTSGNDERAARSLREPLLVFSLVDAGHRWQLASRGDSVVLLTIAWPRHKAGV